jgi:hypothetical protein
MRTSRPGNSDLSSLDVKSGDPPSNSLGIRALSSPGRRQRKERSGFGLGSRVSHWILGNLGNPRKLLWRPGARAPGESGFEPGGVPRSLCGNGLESNPPTGIARRTGPEDRTALSDRPLHVLASCFITGDVRFAPRKSGPHQAGGPGPGATRRGRLRNGPGQPWLPLARRPSLTGLHPKTRLHVLSGQAARPARERSIPKSRRRCSDMPLWRSRPDIVSAGGRGGPESNPLQWAR